MLKKTGDQEERIERGIGFYTASEAARLLRMPVLNINRWLRGYDYKYRGTYHHSEPCGTPELPSYDSKIELSFRDLIELRFIESFRKAGLGLKTIRHCLDFARDSVNDVRPFSTQKFRTDGRTIFLDTIREFGESELLDLKKRQYVIKQVIERSFKDLDIEANAVARWRPFKGKESIVIDPKRAFGQPIAAEYGVPTQVLADAVSVEGSVARVARIFEVPPAVVRDAVNFEEFLLAA